MWFTQGRGGLWIWLRSHELQKKQKKVEKKEWTTALTFNIFEQGHVHQSGCCVSSFFLSFRCDIVISVRNGVKRGNTKDQLWGGCYNRLSYRGHLWSLVKYTKTTTQYSLETEYSTNGCLIIVSQKARYSGQRLYYIFSLHAFVGRSNIECTCWNPIKLLQKCI